MSEGKDEKDEKNEKEIIIKNMAKWNGADILRDGDPKWQKDKDVVLEAVKHNGLALRWASEELKSNPDVALAAVKNNGWAIDHVDLIGVSKQPKNRVKIIINAYKNVKKQEEEDDIKDSLVAFMDFLVRVVGKDGQEIINNYKQLNDSEKLELLDNRAMGKKKKKGTKKKNSPKKRKGTKKKTPPKKKPSPKKKKAPKKKKSSRKRKGSTNGRR